MKCSACHNELAVPEDILTPVRYRCDYCHTVNIYVPNITDLPLSVGDLKPLLPRNDLLLDNFKAYLCEITKTFHPNDDCPYCNQFAAAVKTLKKLLADHICHLDGIPSCKHDMCECCLLKAGPSHYAGKVVIYRRRSLCLDCKAIWVKRGGSFSALKRSIEEKDNS